LIDGKAHADPGRHDIPSEIDRHIESERDTRALRHWEAVGQFLEARRAVPHVATFWFCALDLYRGGWSVEQPNREIIETRTTESSA